MLREEIFSFRFTSQFFLTHLQDLLLLPVLLRGLLGEVLLPALVLGELEAGAVAEPLDLGLGRVLELGCEKRKELYE